MFLTQTPRTAHPSNAPQKVLQICALCAALGTSFFSSQALATAKDFAGFSLGMDLNSDSINTKTDATHHTHDQGNGFTTTRASLQSTESYLNLGLTGTYRHPITEHFLIGVGAQIHLTDTNLNNSGGKVRYTNTNTLFLTPGYAISNTTMLYGKLGIASRKLTGEYAYFPRTDNGTQYGFGAAFALSPQVHLNVEYAFTDYKKFNADSVNAGGNEHYATDANVDTLSVGLAYRF